MAELDEVVEVGELGSPIAFTCKVCVPALTKRLVSPTAAAGAAAVDVLAEIDFETLEVLVARIDRARTDRPPSS